MVEGWEEEGTVVVNNIVREERNMGAKSREDKRACRTIIWEEHFQAEKTASANALRQRRAWCV